MEREEVEARRDPVGAVELAWRDEYTGEVLPQEEVEKVIEEKRSSLKPFKMARLVTEDKREMSGIDDVTTRWLIYRKKSNGC
eukprot:8235493-Heterocapsa_arctica.AAC.1